MDLIEDIMEVIMLESLDSPLKLEKGPSKFDEDGVVEKLLIKRGASSIAIYHTVNFDPEIEFYVYKYKGMWEVHFNNVEAGYSIGALGEYDTKTTLQILSTVVKLAKDKMDKTNGVRIYTTVPKLERLLILHLQRTLPKSSYIYKEIDDYVSITGDNIRRVFEIRPDTRSLRLVPESYVEDIEV